MIDIIAIIREFYDTKNLKKWLNHLNIRACEKVIQQYEFKSIETSEGINFPIDDQFSTIFDILEDYHLDDIKPNDIVIDIGANIGGFALRAAKYSKNVYAVEPVFADRLRENARINNINIHIIEAGIGKSGTSKQISFGGMTKIVPMLSLADIREVSGGCDFLKCDCEGCEWCISMDELNGIRRIEMEIHPGNKVGFNKLMDFLTRHYSVEFNRRSKASGNLGIIHAVKKSDII